jgi:hypothetical protein
LVSCTGLFAADLAGPRGLRRILSVSVWMDVASEPRIRDGGSSETIIRADGQRGLAPFVFWGSLKQFRFQDTGKEIYSPVQVDSEACSYVLRRWQSAWRKCTDAPDCAYEYVQGETCCIGCTKRQTEGNRVSQSWAIASDRLNEPIRQSKGRQTPLTTLSNSVISKPS